MSLEDIEKEFAECVEAVKVFETLSTSQESTYQEHTERLQLLRKLYLAAQSLKECKVEKLDAKTQLENAELVDTPEVIDVDMSAL